MGIDLSKTGHVLFFIVLLPAISLGVGWMFSVFFPSLPFWVETISPLTAYALLYGWFDKHLWHWPVFHWLGIVQAPDMRGRWRGSQVSSYKDKDGKNRISHLVMEVEQSFSHIKVETYYKYWQSERSIASFVKVDGACVLFVMFESSPKVEYDGAASAHKGVMRLSLLPDGKLNGTYFNAAGRSGEISLKRTKYTLYRTFERMPKPTAER